MAKFDYSEYKYDDYEIYQKLISNTNNLILDKSHCRVRFSNNNKFVELIIDQTFASDYEDNLHKRMREEKGIESFDEMAIAEELEKEKAERDDDEDSEDNNLAKLSQRFDIHFYDTVDEDDPYSFKIYDHNLYANALSGSRVCYFLGEGLLDFCSFDISKHLNELGVLALVITKTGQNIVASASNSEPINNEESTIKINNLDDRLDFIHEKWKFTNELANTFFYNSLYTSAFTPVFLSKGDNSLQRYIDYLRILKAEFTERITFCFDEDFYPGVLGSLHPVERYKIYCSVYKNFPTICERTEKFELSRRMVENGKMPYSYDKNNFMNRLNTPVDHETNEYKEFIEKFCNGESFNDFFIKLPTTINITYGCSSIEEMLNLEFTKMLEADIKLRKCKRCGKYFIMKGNYDTKYCDRIEDGQTRNCQELAAQENYKAKTANNPALPIYSKYYKRYAARVRSRQIKEPDFKKWKFQALTKRDECSDGKITPEEYIAWMEDYFPNRKPKNK